MNLGIKHSDGCFIQLLGAHASLSKDYISTAVAFLESNSEAQCVGGVLNTIGRPGIAQAIALAVSSPFGVGNAKFRYGQTSVVEVDTVAFGLYRREVFDRLGLFDEKLPRNDDDELNYRIRKAGGRIMLLPNISANYMSRSTLGKLWRQYFGYGRGKVDVARRHVRMIQARHLVPGLFALYLCAGLLLATFSMLGFVMVATACVCYYTLLVIVSGEIALRNRNLLLFPMLLLVFPVVHFGYGIGSIVGGCTALMDFLLRGNRLGVS